MINPDSYARDTASGFEAISFQKSGEIVISFAGTYDKDNSGDGLTNVGLATGAGATQLLQAVEYYLQIKAANPGASITLTGHSLGGGLASLVGVFFGVQAATFDQAPFAKTAWFKAPDVMAYLVGRVDASGNRLFSEATLAPLSSYIEQKQVFGAPTTLIPNAQLITNISVQGEFLSGPPWTVYSRIGATTETISNTAPDVSGFDLHSQALLTAYLQSRETAPAGQTLSEVTAKLTGLLQLIFDPKLYSYRTDDARNKSFLDHLVRHEAGGIDGIAAGADAMLTRFAADLNKLGTNIAGLNQAAQDAIIAQGIEWYYWQGSDYTGQEFFTRSEGLLQYEAFPASSIPGGDSKADPYIRKWLDPIANQHGAFGVGTTYEQWNVTGGNGAVTAQARDASKSQIFIGNAGVDTFIGGNKDDVMLAGAGNDILAGGGGNDALYGGKGFDSYGFTAVFGADTIKDSDGSGRIVLDGLALSGGKRQSKTIWRSDDDKTEFHFDKDPAGGERGTLRILRTGAVHDSSAITVRDWKPGDLGITLASDSASRSAAPAGNASQDRTLDGERHGPVTTAGGKEFYQWGDPGTYVAEAGFADVFDHFGNFFDNVTASTGGGADAFIGNAGHDSVDTGDGNDLLVGGLGVNTLNSGAGKDIISVLEPNIVFRPSIRRIGPQDHWVAPAGAQVITGATTWGAFRDANGQLSFSAGDSGNGGDAGDDQLISVEKNMLICARREQRPCATSMWISRRKGLSKRTDAARAASITSQGVRV